MIFIATLLNSPCQAPPLLAGWVRLFFRVAFLPVGLHLAWIWLDGYFPESRSNRLVQQLTVDRPLGPDSGLTLHFKVRESWLISLFLLCWPTFPEGWG